MSEPISIPELRRMAASRRPWVVNGLTVTEAAVLAAVDADGVAMRTDHTGRYGPSVVIPIEPEDTK